MLRGLKSFREAEELLSEAIERGSALPSAQSMPLERDAKTALRDLYRAWHAVEPESGYDERAEELDSDLDR